MKFVEKIKKIILSLRQKVKEGIKKIKEFIKNLF